MEMEGNSLPKFIDTEEIEGEEDKVGGGVFNIHCS
jgi:hypothetical protein